MNPTNKKPLPQVGNRAANGKPVTPRVYRPQPTPKVLQKKSSLAQAPKTVQAPRPQPVAPPVYRPLTKQTVQPKTTSQARKPPVASVMHRPEQKQPPVVHKKVLPAPAASRSVQRQHAPGYYQANSFANLRADGDGYKVIGMVKMWAPVTVLDPQGRTSLFKAGWVKNEHSWVEVDHKSLARSENGGESVRGWVNDDNLVAAQPPKGKTKKTVESEPQEVDEAAFVPQVRRLYGTFNRGMPGGLSVTGWLRQLGGNMIGTESGTLAHDMCVDAQKSNSLFIIGEQRARLEDRNWPREIVQNQTYRHEYAQAVRDFLHEEPVAVPVKLKPRSVWEM